MDLKRQDSRIHLLTVISMYAIKEMFYTIQGEGVHTGRPAVFCRFAGCNLWSGLEKDRESAICNFCDTDFVGTDGEGGGKFASGKALAQKAKSLWPKSSLANPYVVCTGGEPLLQMDNQMIDAFHDLDFEIAIETNGTITPPDGIDWICVSPKIGSKLILTSGDVLKLVYPQRNGDPAQFRNLQFDHFSLQPMDGPNLDENTEKTLSYCRQHPYWNVSLQTHKFLGIP